MPFATSPPEVPVNLEAIPVGTWYRGSSAVILWAVCWMQVCVLLWAAWSDWRDFTTQCWQDRDLLTTDAAHDLQEGPFQLLLRPVLRYADLVAEDVLQNSGTGTQKSPIEAGPDDVQGGCMDVMCVGILCRVALARLSCAHELAIYDLPPLLRGKETLEFMDGPCRHFRFEYSSFFVRAGALFFSSHPLMSLRHFSVTKLAFIRGTFLTVELIGAMGGNVWFTVKLRVRGDVGLSIGIGLISALLGSGFRMLISNMQPRRFIYRKVWDAYAIAAVVFAWRLWDLACVALGVVCCVFYGTYILTFFANADEASTTSWRVAAITTLLLELLLMPVALAIVQAACSTLIARRRPELARSIYQRLGVRVRCKRAIGLELDVAATIVNAADKPPEDEVHALPGAVLADIPPSECPKLTWTQPAPGAWEKPLAKSTRMPSFRIIAPSSSTSDKTKVVLDTATAKVSHESLWAIRSKDVSLGQVDPSKLQRVLQHLSVVDAGQTSSPSSSPPAPLWATPSCVAGMQLVRVGDRPLIPATSGARSLANSPGMLLRHTSAAEPPSPPRCQSPPRMPGSPDTFWRAPGHQPLR